MSVGPRLSLRVELFGRLGPHLCVCVRVRVWVSLCVF